jgi:hypothetical protein
MQTNTQMQANKQMQMWNQQTLILDRRISEPNLAGVQL